MKSINIVIPLILMGIGAGIFTGAILQTLAIVDSKWEGGVYYIYACSEGDPYNVVCKWIKVYDLSAKPIDFYVTTGVLQFSLNLWYDEGTLQRLKDMKICGDKAEPVWWGVNQSGVVVARTHPDDYEPWATLNVGCSYYIRPIIPTTTPTPPPETDINIAIPSHVSGGGYTKAQEQVGINATSPEVVISNVAAGQPISTPAPIVFEEKAPAAKAVEVVKEVEKKVEVKTGFTKKLFGGGLILIGLGWLYLSRK